MQNIDQHEVNKFSQQAAQWWDHEGPFKPLHEINPLRLSYIQQRTELKGLRVLDVGCGGGILTESMVLAGAEVTGLDASAEVIAIARLHQLESNLQIDYQTLSTAELAAQKPQSYDVVTCMEMLEHVPAPDEIVHDCAKLVKPGGKIFFSTINRELKAYLFAILGAEYLLRLLPQGTHDYAKFIRPSELDSWARDSGLCLVDLTGMSYNPLSKKYFLTKDIAVNYLACYQA